MNSRFKAAQRQSGLALLVLLAALVIVSAAILLERLGGQANASARHDVGNAKALAEAKAALIAWAVTIPPSAARESTVGNLPYPDRYGDGNYDGLADCDPLVLTDVVLVGRLPHLGEEDAASINCALDSPVAVSNRLNVDVYDNSGEPLWYAVSRNVLPGVGDAGGPINPDMGGVGRMTYPWIQLRDEQGDITHPNAGGPSAVAAVIFAPGAVVGNQIRSASTAANFLDSVAIAGNTYDNADADGCPDNTTPPCDGDSNGVNDGEEFVAYPNPRIEDAFNDQLVYITVDELMRAAEKRVLGEAVQALRTYRLSGWNTGMFPWLARFRSPRFVAAGAADSGNATQLNDAAGNFIAKEVQAGDIIVNLDDSSSGPITQVTATTLNVDALAGGIENDFDAGENYEVHPSFKSTSDGAGQLPVHLPNEIFNTGFTANWDLRDFGDDASDFYESGNLALWADIDELRVKSLTFAPNEGICMWTHKDRVDCYGIKVLGGHMTPSGYWVDQRTIEVQFSFEAANEWTPTSAAISGPSAAVRTRSVTIQSTCATPPVDPLDDCGSPNGPWFPEPSRFGALTPPQLDVAPFLPQDRDATPGDDETWVVRITDTDVVAVPNTGVRAVIFDNDVYGSVTLSGIRYDLGVAYDDVDDGDDELPEWFVENNWHHFIYAAIAPDFVGTGDGDCVSSTTCLTLNATGTQVLPDDIGALLISAGAQRSVEDRDIGECDGVLGLTANDSFLCAYFDGENNDKPVTPDVYARDVYDNTFNDQIRIIEPLPP